MTETVTATEFKAKCLDILDRLGNRQVDRIAVTNRIPPHSSGWTPHFLTDAKTWFDRAIAGPGLRLAPLTREIAIDSSQLPGLPLGDPADRMIVATARDLGAAIVMRDRLILTYAAQGHVAALTC